MTRAEWKRAILSGLAVTLDEELGNMAEWLFLDAAGESLPEADEKRMRAAVADLHAEFVRRGRGTVTPHVSPPRGCSCRAPRAGREEPSR